MVASGCLSREAILDFSLGKVSVALETQVVEHLGHCVICREAAALCDREVDPLIAALRSADVHSLSSEDARFVRSTCGRRPVSEVEHFGPVIMPPTKKRLHEYELVRKLGEGGMGTIYEARHMRLDRIVALKVLPPGHLQDPGAIARFQREMRAVGALDHPAIVRANDAGEVDGTHFLVMEYVEGLDLAHLSEVAGRLRVADACELVRQAAEGLQHVHERGMVHRDVKPSNLMLTPLGQVKILDLGLALLQEDDGEHELTTVGRFLGTLDYMAPEQADDSHDVDIRADVYGLGATLYRLLCAAPPFSGPQFRSPLKKFRALALLQAPAVSEHRTDVPSELEAVVLRMLAKEPEQRFATPAEVAQALRCFTEESDLVGLAASVANRTKVVRSRESQLPGSRNRGPTELPREVVKLPSAPLKGSGRYWLFGLLTLGLVFAAVASVIIRVQTDRGELVITSPKSDLDVSIRKGDGSVETLELTQGTNKVMIRSGTYEIELGTSSDSLKITGSTFSLSRGGSHLATIEEVSSKVTKHVTAPMPAADEPTYEGKTFVEWLRAMRTERKERSIIEAMFALAKVAEGDRATEVVSLLLDEAQRHGDILRDRSWPKPPDEVVMRGTIHALQQLDPQASVSGLARELDGREAARRLYALYALKRESVGAQIANTIYSRNAIPVEDARTTLPAVLRASHDSHPRVRQLAIQVAVELDATAPEVNRRLHEALDDSESSVFIDASLRLLQIDPDSENLRSALIRILRDSTLSLDVRTLAAAHLAKTAPETGGLLDVLETAIEQKDDEGTSSGVNVQIQRRAIMAMEDLGPQAAPAAPVLLQFINGDDLLEKAMSFEPHPDVPNRSKSIAQLAVEALESMGPAAATPEVKKAFQEMSQRVENMLGHTDKFQKEKLTSLLSASAKAMKHIGAD